MTPGGVSRGACLNGSPPQRPLVLEGIGLLFVLAETNCMHHTVQLLYSIGVGHWCGALVWGIGVGLADDRSFSEAWGKGVRV